MYIFNNKIVAFFGASLCIGLLLFSETSMGARLSGDDQSVISSEAPSGASPAPAGAKQDSKASKETAKDAVQAGPENQESQRGDSSSADKETAAKKTKKNAARQQKTAKAPAEKNAGKYVTIDFDNVDIQVFIKSIGEMTGKNFIIDNQVKGNVSIYSPKKISVEEAYKVFESVLEVHGFTTVPSGNVIKIIPSKDAREKNIETRLKMEAISPEDKIVTQIITLTQASPDEMKKILDPLISRSSIILSYPPTGMLVVTDVLSNVKRLLRIISALDVPGSGEQISVIPLRNATAQTVAKALTGIFQADPAHKGMSQPMRILPDDRTNTVIVMAKEFYTLQIKQLITLLDKEVPRGASAMHVYRLQNANAEDLAKVLMSLPQKETAKGAASAEKGTAPIVSKEVQILADKATNTLIITASPADYRVLEDVIRSLDVSRSMVYLEALIMEVDITKNFQLGVEWRFMNSVGSNAIFGGSGGLGPSSAPGSYSIFPAPTVGTTAGQIAATFPSGFSVGILGGGITLGGVTFPTVGAALQALYQDQTIHILSTPQILTLDNEDAEIRVGQNIPYITSQQLATGTTLNYSNYEYRDVGVILKITPHINQDGFVRMKIGQEVTTLVSESTPGLPTTLKRTANTTVIVKDNHTVVIGGIIGDSTTTANYQVPCLGNLPVIGNLFKSRSYERDKTDLFIFLTPRIVRTQSEASDIYQEKRSTPSINGQPEGGVIKLYDKENKSGSQQAAPQGMPADAQKPASPDKQ